MLVKFGISPQTARFQHAPALALTDLILNEPLLAAIQAAAGIYHDTGGAGLYPNEAWHGSVLQPVTLTNSVPADFFSAGDLARIEATRTYFNSHGELPATSPGSTTYYSLADFVARFDTFFPLPGRTFVDVHWLYFFVLPVPDSLEPVVRPDHLIPEDLAVPLLNAVSSSLQKALSTDFNRASGILRLIETEDRPWWLPLLEAHKLFKGKGPAEWKRAFLRFYEGWYSELPPETMDGGIRYGGPFGPINNLRLYLTESGIDDPTVLVDHFGFPASGHATAIAKLDAFRADPSYDKLPDVGPARKLLEQVVVQAATKPTLEAAARHVTFAASVFSTVGRGFDAYTGKKLQQETDLAQVARSFAKVLLETNQVAIAHLALERLLGSDPPGSIWQTAGVEPREVAAVKRTTRETAAKDPFQPPSQNPEPPADRQAYPEGSKPETPAMWEANGPYARLMAASALNGVNQVGVSGLSAMFMNYYDQLAGDNQRRGQGTPPSPGAKGERELNSGAVNSATLQAQLTDLGMQLSSAVLGNAAADAMSQKQREAYEAFLAWDVTKNVSGWWHNLGLPPAVYTGLDKVGSAAKETITPFVQAVPTVVGNVVQAVLSGKDTQGVLEAATKPFNEALNQFLPPPQRLQVQKDNIFIRALGGKQLFNERARAYSRSLGKPRVYLRFYDSFRGTTPGGVNDEVVLEFFPLPGISGGGEQPNPFGLPGIVMKTRMNIAEIPIAGGVPTLQALGVAQDTIELSGIFVPYKTGPVNHRFLSTVGPKGKLLGPTEETLKVDRANEAIQELIWSGGAEHEDPMRWAPKETTEFVPLNPARWQGEHDDANGTYEQGDGDDTTRGSTNFPALYSGRRRPERTAWGISEYWLAAIHAGQNLQLVYEYPTNDLDKTNQKAKPLRFAYTVQFKELDRVHVRADKTWYKMTLIRNYDDFDYQKAIHRVLKEGKGLLSAELLKPKGPAQRGLPAESLKVMEPQAPAPSRPATAGELREQIDAQLKELDRLESLWTKNGGEIPKAYADKLTGLRAKLNGSKDRLDAGQPLEAHTISGIQANLSEVQTWVAERDKLGQEQAPRVRAPDYFPQDLRYADRIAYEVASGVLSPEGAYIELDRFYKQLKAQDEVVRDNLTPGERITTYDKTKVQALNRLKTPGTAYSFPDLATLKDLEQGGLAKLQTAMPAVASKMEAHTKKSAPQTPGEVDAKPPAANAPTPDRRDPKVTPEVPETAQTHSGSTRREKKPTPQALAEQAQKREAEQAKAPPAQKPVVPPEPAGPKAPSTPAPAYNQAVVAKFPAGAKSLVESGSAGFNLTADSGRELQVRIQYTPVAELAKASQVKDWHVYTLPSFHGTDFSQARPGYVAWYKVDVAGGGKPTPMDLDRVQGGLSTYIKTGSVQVR